MSLLLAQPQPDCLWRTFVTFVIEQEEWEFAENIPWTAVPFPIGMFPFTGQAQPMRSSLKISTNDYNPAIADVWSEFMSPPRSK